MTDIYAQQSYEPRDISELSSIGSVPKLVTVKYTAGLIPRGKLRNFLAEEKFLENIRDFHESKGLFVSEFIIRGTESQIKEITVHIDNYIKQLEGRTKPR